MSHSDVRFRTARTELFTGRLNRRHFIYTSALAAGALATGIAPAAPKLKSPNDKLNIGCIGANGKGAQDMMMVNAAGENIVAICDVNTRNLAAASAQYPGATGLYADYRVMLEKEKSLDAVTVSIPDHSHAPATMLAMSLGKHIYCQKPLTHTLWEARQITLAARKYGVITQMGNQGHSGEGNRQLCEMVWSGAIGPVREVHCWTDRPVKWWPQGYARPTSEDAPPPYLNWNLWLGPAPERPYADHWALEWLGNPPSPVYQPFVWRGWWDFGCGTLGDMGCHIMDGPVWALKLGPPTSVEIVESSPVNNEMAPASCVFRYQFPARDDMPSCTLTWYDAKNKPPKPKEMEAADFDASGAMLVGDKGKIISGTYGERPRLLPESSMADYKRPAATLPRIPDQNHYQDWIRACKGGPPACSNFDVAGPFTETVLLGNLALRLGKKMEWDSVNLRCPNAPEADALIKKHYREGWTV